MSERLEWRAMVHAPRDGTPILALYDDYSGVEIVRFGCSDETGEDAWFCLDWTDEVSPVWAGWLPLPDIEQWSKWAEGPEQKIEAAKVVKRKWWEINGDEG